MAHQVIGSCPLDCPDACSWIVTVDDEGRAIQLRGNPDHPFTRGGLCPKVNPWLRYAVDPSRLTRPLRRVGPKGSGRFELVGWDEAIAEMAERLNGVIERHGPAAIWPFAGTGNVGWIQGASGPQRLWQRLGTSGHQVTICSVSGHVGLGFTQGTAAGVDPEEVVHAGVVLIWGSNTLVANQHWWPFVEQARRRGAEVVVIDPVAHRTARRADRHLALMPGTDGALALGLCRALIERGAHDPSAVGRYLLGFDEFAASIAEWTLDRTAQVTGLEPGEIEGLVDLLAERGPLMVKLGQGMQRHAHGGQAARCVSCLPAILGSYEQVGGGLVYSTSDPYRLAHPTQGKDLRPRWLAMTNLGRNLTELDDPPVEALIVYGANPLVSNPQRDLVRRGLGRDDLFTVVIELFATETAEWADLVLPSTMQHEQFEINDSFSHLYLNLNRPAVEPPGECLPHTEIFRRLGAALGHDDPWIQASDEQLARDLLDREPYRSAGVTLDTLSETGWVRLPGTDPYRPFADRFPTPSGRFELVSERAERQGHGRLPHYRPPAEIEREPGEYLLVAAASRWHVNSVFADTEVTRSRTAAPPVTIHPADAERDGLSDGDEVELVNERGAFSARLRVDPAARPGVAHTTKGWWRQGINATVAERDSDMGRGAVYHDNRVRIRGRSPAAATPIASEAPP